MDGMSGRALSARCVSHGHVAALGKVLTDLTLLHKRVQLSMITEQEAMIPTNLFLVYNEYAVW